MTPEDLLMSWINKHTGILCVLLNHLKSWRNDLDGNFSMALSFMNYRTVMYYIDNEYKFGNELLDNKLFAFIYDVIKSGHWDLDYEVIKMKENKYNNSDLVNFFERLFSADVSEYRDIFHLRMAEMEIEKILR